MKRRDFLKTAAIASTAVSVSSLTTSATGTGGSRSRVVIANDPQCYSGNAAVPARVQEMVDRCIMTLTGQTIRGAAYEALFPRPVTAATKIVVKYNNNFNLTSSPSHAAVYNALRAGLTAMLGGTFPVANISAFGGFGTPASGNPQFTIGSVAYRIQNAIMDCDYFINLAACWAMGLQFPCGVTMTQKNMMSAVGVGALSNFHAYFTNATSPALAILNSQPVFRQKQVLALIDGIAIRTDTGPGGSPNKVAYSVIASKDMVAADYQGLLILKANGLSADRETMARNVFNLSAGAPYNLGNADPANVDVVTIAAPWNTQVVWNGKSAERLGLKVRTERHAGGTRVHFMPGKKIPGDPELSIFTLQGQRIWSSPTLEWNGETSGGRRAGSGPYLFSLTAGRRIVSGRIVLDR